MKFVTMLNEIDYGDLTDEFVTTKNDILLKLKNNTISKEQALDKANELLLGINTQINLAGYPPDENWRFMLCSIAAKVLIKMIIHREY